MKFCTQCGNGLIEGAVFCTNCGCSINYQPVSRGNPTLQTVAKAFMVLGTVVLGILIIPLVWCLPMTIKYFRKVRNGEPVSVAFKVCTLLFVNQIAGIVMLCDYD